MKKLLTALMAVFFMAAVSACGDDATSDANPSDPDANTSDVEITSDVSVAEETDSSDDGTEEGDE